MASRIVVNLDTSKENFLIEKCVQGDDITIEANIFENGVIKNLTNHSVVINVLKPDNTFVVETVEAQGVVGNKITKLMDPQTTTAYGIAKVVITLTDNAQLQNSTFEFKLDVKKFVTEGAVASATAVPIVQELTQVVAEATKVKNDTDTVIKQGGAARGSSVFTSTTNPPAVDATSTNNKENDWHINPNTNVFSRRAATNWVKEGVLPVDIMNNLTTTTPGSALDANQGSVIDTRLKYLENNTFKTYFNVQEYKTATNTWEQALATALTEAEKVVENQQDTTTTLWLGVNPVVKMPRGIYEITKPITIPKWIDLDLTGCIFKANPLDKTLVCFTGEFFRTTITKGTWWGFGTALQLNTNNSDTSYLHLINPTFHVCGIGLDTVSYEKSRSTNVRIEDLYSTYTDQALKVHTDMCTVKGGWIQQSDNQTIATIENHAFMSLEDIVFVPYTATATAGTRRYIDNYGSNNNNDRSLSIYHCRFGGEQGSPTIIHNYNKFKTGNPYYQQKPCSSIQITDCIIECGGRVPIKLFQIPNLIKIKGCHGLTVLDNGLISIETGADINGATREFISIDLEDISTDKTYPLFAEKDKLLYTFLRNKRNFTEKTFAKLDLGRKIAIVDDAVNTAKYIDIPMNLSPYAGGTEQAHADSLKTSFLLAVHGQTPDWQYTTSSLYYITLVGKYISAKSQLTTEALSQQISVQKGGIDGALTTELTKMAWDTTGTTELNSRTITGNEKLRVYFTNNLSSVEIIPLSGDYYPSKHY